MGQLNSFAQFTGYKVYDKIAYGRTNAIYFNVRFLNFGAQAQVFAFVKSGSGGDLGKINAYLKENCKQYKTGGAQSDGRAVSFVINSMTRVKPENAARIIDDFSRFLTDKGYRSTCAFCDQNNNVGHTAQNGLVLETCETCHEKFSGIVNDIQQERDTTGSYAKGAAGAVLGGILGIIPWVLFYFAGLISALSGLVMAFFCYKGYVLFKGKRGKGMLVIIIAVLVVFTYVSVLANQCITEYQYYAALGYDVDIGALFSTILAAPFMPAEFETGLLWGQIGSGLFFAGLGSFFFLRKVRKESTGQDVAVKRIGRDLYS
ncbi:MAG: hypothetical protein PHO15_05490 [Eubacteriales bacterium]|nr:hypothetical protein [Eubacteriales bacterium]